MTRSATKKKTGKDPAYLNYIRSLPCRVCCGIEWPLPLLCHPLGPAFTLGQRYATEAAHVGDRGMSQKCPDREAVPLCAECHREGRAAAHKLGKHFWEYHGLDKNVLIRELQTRYESTIGTRAS